MNNLLDNLIEVIGISNSLPEHERNFKEFHVQEIVHIPDKKPDIEQIVSISAYVIIDETTIISTPTGTSYEGQILDGKKLLVRGKLIQKVEYIANCPLQSVHVAEFEKLFSNYIVVEGSIDFTHPITVVPYIEDIYIKQISSRKIFKNILLLINAVSPVSDSLNSKSVCNKEEKITDRYQISKFCSNKCIQKGYFTQFVSMEEIVIPDEKPDIEQVISTIVDPQIISMKIVNTTKGLSREGQYLSGKKIAVEIKIGQKILYAANVINQSMHGTENEHFQSAYVVIPEYIEGTDTEILLKHKLLQPKITVEDVFIMQLDKRRIFKNVTLHLEFCYIPTYEICYSYYKNCPESNLYVMYEDGRHNNQITHIEDGKYIKPAWSPDGQQIAFISDYEGRNSIKMMNIKGPLPNELICPEKFRTIGSFCWSADGKKLVFSAAELKCKEIYSVDIASMKLQQLTDGHGFIKSYKPKCSPQGEKIAYIKLESQIPNLWMCDLDGFNMKQLTGCNYIIDFDWQSCGEIIVCIAGKGDKSDVLIGVNIKYPEIKTLLDSDGINEKRGVRVSPDYRYAAFIGSKCKNGGEDIYIYEFCSKSVFNLTQNCDKVKISDFCWKVDSSKIYFAADELGYYNLYSVSLLDFCREQLTNSTAFNMQLSYRQRVK